jgi:hypothetical protein
VQITTEQQPNQPNAKGIAQGKGSAGTSQPANANQISQIYQHNPSTIKPAQIPSKTKQPHNQPNKSDSNQPTIQVQQIQSARHSQKGQQIRGSYTSAQRTPTPKRKGEGQPHLSGTFRYQCTKVPCTNI